MTFTREARLFSALEDIANTSKPCHGTQMGFEKKDAVVRTYPTASSPTE
jgi:hypothetical protein